ncbi:MAG: lipase family protein [Rhizobiaceae bacterium]|nr:lipase family protein [Rhizobiaceae bacterium]
MRLKSPNRLPDMVRHVVVLVMVAIASLTLAGCIGSSSKELAALGATVTATEVDFVELYAYAGRAKAAYSAESEIRRAYPSTVTVNSPGDTGAQYFVERDDQARTQYVSVRGTANKKNVAEDMEIALREDSAIDIPVHSGFDATAETLYADMKPHLRNGYKTYVTGHSLGGAIAALLAIYMVEDGHNVVRVVTFGQPKFTTSAGAKRLGFLALTRVVDENDMVPMLPPITTHDKTHGAYEHVGPEVILLEGPHYVFLADHDAERLSVNEFWRSVSFASLTDHHMDKYLGRLSSKSAGGVEVPYNRREKYVAAKPASQTETARQ